MMGLFSALSINDSYKQKESARNLYAHSVNQYKEEDRM